MIFFYHVNPMLTVRIKKTLRKNVHHLSRVENSKDGTR